jgi:sugar transferase (PEP-CTERM/EpsH1 system associated)
VNVLFLTHRLPYAPNRGDRIRAYFLLSELAKFSSVSLFSLVHDDEEAAHVNSVPWAEQVATARVHRAANVLRGALTLLSERPLTHSLLDGEGAKGTLERLVADRKPDVVLALCSSMARFALEPPLAGLPFVLDMIDVDSYKWKLTASESSGIMRWIYSREARTLATFEAAAVRKARTTFVVTDRERDALLTVVPDGRIEVVRMGIDLEAFEPSNEPSSKPAVVFCGVVSYGPNEAGICWFAEEVWPIVRSLRPDATFAVVGSGHSRAVAELGRSGSAITVTGAVPKVQPYLWDSAVAIAPLKIARGTQNKVLEALAAGLPVVVTSPVWDGLPDCAKPGCIRADAPSDFAAAIVRLLSLSGNERRAVAESADLRQLGWRTQLAPIEPALRDAAQH